MQCKPPHLLSMAVSQCAYKHYIDQIYLAYQQLALGVFLFTFIKVFGFNHLIPYTMLENHSLGSYDLSLITRQNYHQRSIIHP